MLFSSKLRLISNPALVLKSPETEAEWQQYYALRYQVLRKPWLQPPGSERLSDDADAQHAIALSPDGQVVGAGRLHTSAGGVGQVRMMAVHPAWQGKGVGRAVALYLEEKARAQGLTELMLEARETAIPFYTQLGYTGNERSYLLYGTIQHYTMRKKLQ